MDACVLTGGKNTKSMMQIEDDRRVNGSVSGGFCAETRVPLRSVEFPFSRRCERRQDASRLSANALDCISSEYRSGKNAAMRFRSKREIAN